MTAPFYQPNVVALPPTPQEMAMLSGNQNVAAVLQPRQQGRAAQRATGAMPGALRAGEEQQVGKYRIIRSIGRGNFARVKLARHVLTGKEVAIKIIDKAQFSSGSLQKVYREVRIMRQLDHPNIVKLYEVIDGGRYLYLVIEYVPNGEMFDYIVRNGKMKEAAARARFRQIISAVQYAHARRVVHRDLKAENLLLDAEYNVKLCDFGFANDYRHDRKLDTFCGSPPYAAPELYLGQKYVGPEVDVWSMGVILYVMISGTLPFEGGTLQVLRDKVVRGKYRVPFWMSADCESLVRRCLTVNPSRRVTLEHLMINDRWLNVDSEPLRPVTFDPGVPDTQVDHAVVQTMSRLGFGVPDVMDSVSKRKYDHTYATYLILKTTATVPGSLAAAGPIQSAQTQPAPLPPAPAAANYNRAPLLNYLVPSPQTASSAASHYAAPQSQTNANPYAAVQFPPAAQRKASTPQAIDSEGSRGVLKLADTNRQGDVPRSLQTSSSSQQQGTRRSSASTRGAQEPQYAAFVSRPDAHRETLFDSAADAHVETTFDSSVVTKESELPSGTVPPVLPPRDFRNRPQQNTRRSGRRSRHEAGAKKKQKEVVPDLDIGHRRESSADRLAESEPWVPRSNADAKRQPTATASDVRGRRDSYKRVAENLMMSEEQNADSDVDADADADSTRNNSVEKSENSLKSDSAVLASGTRTGVPESMSVHSFANQRDALPAFRNRKEAPTAIAGNPHGAVNLRTVASMRDDVRPPRLGANQSGVGVGVGVTPRTGLEKLNEPIVMRNSPTRLPNVRETVHGEAAAEQFDEDEQAAVLRREKRYFTRDKYSSLKKARLIAMDNEQLTPTPALTQFTALDMGETANDENSSSDEEDVEEEADDDDTQRQFERDSALQQESDEEEQDDVTGNADEGQHYSSFYENGEQDNQEAEQEEEQEEAEEEEDEEEEEEEEQEEEQEEESEEGEEYEAQQLATIRDSEYNRQTNYLQQEKPVTPITGTDKTGKSSPFENYQNSASETEDSHEVGSDTDANHVEFHLAEKSDTTFEYSGRERTQTATESYSRADDSIGTVSSSGWQPITSSEYTQSTSAAINASAANELLSPDLAVLMQHAQAQMKRDSIAPLPKNSVAGFDAYTSNENEPSALWLRRESTTPSVNGLLLGSQTPAQLYPSISQAQVAYQPATQAGVDSQIPALAQQASQQSVPRGWLPIYDTTGPMQHSTRTYQDDYSGGRSTMNSCSASVSNANVDRRKSKSSQSRSDKGGFFEKLARLFRRPPSNKAGSKTAPHHRSAASVGASEREQSAMSTSRSGTVQGSLHKSATTSPAKSRYGQSDSHVHSRGKQPRVVRSWSAKLSKPSALPAEQLLAELENALEENSCTFQVNTRDGSVTGEVLPFELVCAYQDVHDGRLDCHWLMEVVELSRQRMTAVRSKRLDGDETRYRGLITRLLNQLSI